MEEAPLSPDARRAAREDDLNFLVEAYADTERSYDPDLDGSLVHPREVFKGALLSSAASVILLHNHPSGDPDPSAEDREVTRKLVEAGRLLGVPVLDHVIVGVGAFYSFRERRAL